MWTKELTKKLEELGYGWDTYNLLNNIYMDIYNPQDEDDPDEAIASVCVNKPYILSTDTYKLNDFCEEYQKELYELLTEYSSTPEDEREDPNQKYTYKHRSLKTRHGKDAYLAISLLTGYEKYSPDLVDEAKDTKEYQVLFTNAEIEKYNKELGIDLDNYIKEEVPTKESNNYTEGRQVNL